MSKIAHWRFDIAPTNGVIYDELNGVSGLTATWNTTPPEITTEYGKQGVRVNGSQWAILSGQKDFYIEPGISIISNIILNDINQRYAMIFGVNGGYTPYVVTDNSIFIQVPDYSTYNNYGLIRASWHGGSAYLESGSNTDSTIKKHPTYVAAVINTSKAKVFANSMDISKPLSIATKTSLRAKYGRLLSSIYDNTGILGFVTDIALYDHALTDKELLDSIGASVNKLGAPTPLWGNYETRLSAWPGENSYKQLDSQTAEKVYGITTAAMLNGPPLRKDFGFIEGVITRKTAPAVGQHVICLDDKFNLVSETLSGAGGYYRFDSLPINGLYAIHAYDNNEYKYAPVGADRRTPEAYS